jgi:hypothetical protein
MRNAAVGNEMYGLYGKQRSHQARPSSPLDQPPSPCIVGTGLAPVLERSHSSLSPSSPLSLHHSRRGKGPIVPKLG